MVAFWTIPRLTKAPDSHSHKLESFVDPTGAYGENPSFHSVAERPLSPRYAQLKGSNLKWSTLVLIVPGWHKETPPV